MAERRTPVALVVLDGWGLNPNPEGNAVHHARTPNFDRYWSTYPHTQLIACGEAVGLVDGQMGDSNVGHLNLGAGRVVYQTLVRIHRAVATGSFFTLPIWQQVLAALREKGGDLHLMGLVSDGGVHSHLTHLRALLELAGRQGLSGDRVWVHAFTDGRDVSPTSAPGYVRQLEEWLAGGRRGRIATVSGRYYAMDRDKRWERTERAFTAIVRGEGVTASSAAAAIHSAYDRHETDEFILPTVMLGATGQPLATLNPERDVVVCFNFRPDRMRQLVRALFETVFSGFARRGGFQPVPVFTMTQYDQDFGLPVAFRPEFITRPLGQAVSEAGLTQLRIAETEKYPHVSYFFNGGEESVFPGEERVMIPSPKVATYDLKPEMSAYEVADAAVRSIAAGQIDFTVLNFANPDMVGHTGVFAAAVRACEVVDECLGRVVEAIRERAGAALVLADHGNADQMIDYETGLPHTNHTLHPVPCILVDDTRLDLRLRPGVLGNAAPTLLDVIGIRRPPEMGLDSLIERE